MGLLTELSGDLSAEQAALDQRVATLPEEVWDRPTPAEGWTVRDQISHLAFFDATAALALTDPERFAAHLRSDGPALAGGARAETPDVALGRGMSPGELLAGWRAGRSAVLDALAGADSGTRVPWYGPPMSPASFVTARIMETWAHGQDVVDALGLPPVVSDRLRHVIDLGVRARPYSFRVHGVDDPGHEVSVEALAPDGSLWRWGSADEAIRGPALDVALVFTQRRHPSDTSVVAEGPTAEAWLALAQAFAGPAGPGRPAGGPL